jgi:hypothetical protein
MEQTLVQGGTKGCKSVFRTEAWVQAWIDTWGQDPRIELIDLGGKKDPLQTVYRIKQRLKKVLPLTTLVNAGFGFGSLSTPRAEYNSLQGLVDMAGGVLPLQRQLDSLSWSQYSLADISAQSTTNTLVRQLEAMGKWHLRLVKSEPAYSIKSTDFPQYLAGLGANTRAIYFNRRQRLQEHGEISFRRYQCAEADEFFALLNNFHIPRWGCPCYSEQSQQFMTLFCQRLNAAGGRAIMESMSVAGEIVSVLFDVEWQGVRYNFQSGYNANKFNRIALGSIHFGYAIEQALTESFSYDLMAGVGKHSDYKAKIATHVIEFNSYMLVRGAAKYLYKISGR